MGNLLNPTHLIETFGLIGVALFVFAESGLLIGFFLPGDSLLITAGILAAAGKLPIAVLVPIVFIAAVVGDQVGYVIGARGGPALFRRPDSRWFKQEHLNKAKTFYDRKGGMTIVLARFIPIVRTFAPVVAGAAKMQYRSFLAFNVLGGFLWGVGVTMAGYFLGKKIPNIDKYLLPVIAVVVVASLIPVVVAAIRSRRQKHPSP